MPNSQFSDMHLRINLDILEQMSYTDFNNAGDRNADFNPRMLLN